MKPDTHRAVTIAPCTRHWLGARGWRQEISSSLISSGFALGNGLPPLGGWMPFYLVHQIGCVFCKAHKDSIIAQAVSPDLRSQEHDNEQEAEMEEEQAIRQSGPV